MNHYYPSLTIINHYTIQYIHIPNLVMDDHSYWPAGSAELAVHTLGAVRTKREAMGTDQPCGTAQFVRFA